MRYIISILLAAILAGCSSPAHPTFVTTFGNHALPSGKWRIKASDSSLEISRPSNIHAGDWITDKPNNWKAQTGWFVYVESQSSVWAYDGDRRLVLLELTGVEDYSAMSEMLFQRDVPREVFSRLSPDTQQDIAFLKKQPNPALEPAKGMQKAE